MFVSTAPTRPHRDDSSRGSGWGTLGSTRPRVRARAREKFRPQRSEPVATVPLRSDSPRSGIRAGGIARIVNLMVQYSPTVDRAFAALADPTRRAVLERLGAGSATISELAKPFGMSLTGMKKHIRLLEQAELVTTEKVGRVRRCMLVPYAFEGISTWLQRLDRFAQVVERTKGAR
jgi:DNA-binding transcriptional ArsR family regulator